MDIGSGTIRPLVGTSLCTQTWQPSRQLISYSYPQKRYKWESIAQLLLPPNAPIFFEGLLHHIYHDNFLKIHHLVRLAK